MESFYQDIMAVIIPAASTAIGLLITLALYKLKIYVQSQTNNQITLFAFDRLSDIIKTTVDELEQSIKEAGADGKITIEEAQRLKELAINKTHNQLPADLKNILEKATGDLKEWINSKIEQSVYSNKK